MRSWLIGVAAAAALTGVAAAASGPRAAPDGLPLRTVADVTLPESSSRFDYESLDPATDRLYVADSAAGRVLVFDLRSRRVVKAIAAPGAHGVLAVPDAGRVFVSATARREVLTVDAGTDDVLARTRAGEYPDGIAWDPLARRAFVSDERGRAVIVIDGRGARVGAIALGGEAGNVQYDAVSRQVLVDVQTRNELAVIDPRVDRVVARLPLPGCAHDHGLLVDAPARLAFAACDRNAKLVTVDLARMRVAGLSTVGTAPDVLALDSAGRRLYVASESGIVAVFAERGAGLAKLGQGVVAPAAHTVAVDPRTHLVYFALANGPSAHATLRIAAPASPPASNANPAFVFADTALRPGPWVTAATAGNTAADATAFLRASVDKPTALAFTVTATPPQPIDVFWSVSCDGTDNDVYLNEQDEVTVDAPAVGYPPTLAGAFVCFVTVRASPTAGGHVETAILGY